MESLRPPGNVEVMCSYPGCNVAWWVDPLDPRLPGGPFDCGADHEVDRLVFQRLSALRIRFGVHAEIAVPEGPTRPNNPCDNRSFFSGTAVLQNRDRTQQGLLRWEQPLDLADVDKSFAAITWGIDTSEYGLPSNHPSPIGYVPWVGYKTGERVRRYALVPCCRRGCGFMVHVDVDDPDFVPPANWIVGAWGAGDMPPPSWWGRQFVCGEGMGSLPSVPCHLIHGSVIDEVEQAGIRWTVWHRRGRHAGTVLWYAPHTRMYGTLSYTDEKDFFSAEALRDAIRWGSLGELYLWLSLRGGGYDEVVEEIARHVKATS